MNTAGIAIGVAVPPCPDCSYVNNVLTVVQCNTCSQFVDENPQNIANRNISMLFKIIDTLNQQINDLTARVVVLERSNL